MVDVFREFGMDDMLLFDEEKLLLDTDLFQATPPFPAVALDLRAASILCLRNSNSSLSSSSHLCTTLRNWSILLDMFLLLLLFALSMELSSVKEALRERLHEEMGAFILAAAAAAARVSSDEE